MIVFEISINGKKLCTVGPGSDLGILTAIVSWTRRDVSQLPTEVQSEVPEEELKLSISGQRHHDDQSVENLQWEGRALKTGDDIRIRVVERDHVDAPDRIKKVKPRYVRPKGGDRTLH